MSPPYRVLFICSANACRSQMAEAILRHLGGDRFIARSAGVAPASQVHPLALQALEWLDIPAENQYPKSMAEVLDLEHDIVLTVCDAAACLAPPDWRGDPVVAHWSLPDPVLYPGSAEDQLAVARQVAEKLRDWIKQLVTLPLDRLGRQEIRDRLYRIAET